MLMYIQYRGGTRNIKVMGLINNFVKNVRRARSVTACFIYNYNYKHRVKSGGAMPCSKKVVGPTVCAALAIIIVLGCFFFLCK